MRIALGLEYNGASFHGWQYQPGLETVQGALERALGRIIGQQATVFCAGRTDAGVHARCQVVHFDSPVERPLTAWVRGVNSHLPDDVTVLWARQVSDRFHARFDAHTRHYRYILLNRAVRPALHHGLVGWVHRPLNLEVMRQVSVCLIGEHDFSTFRASDCQAKNPVKTMRAVTIGQERDCFFFDFAASAFLHHMVRNLVGALVAVGTGVRSPSWFAEIMEAKNRRLAASTMSPAGLYLTKIEYDPQWTIPSTDGEVVFPQNLLL